MDNTMKPPLYIAVDTRGMWQTYKWNGIESDPLTYDNLEPHKMWKTQEACQNHCDKLEKSNG